MPYQPGTPNSDQVPMTGPWQADPTIQSYLAYYNSRPVNRARGSAAAADPTWQAAAEKYSRYIEANRQKLGIPSNYFPDPRTGGRTLYDPNNNQLRDAALTGGALAAGGYGAGILLGPGAAPIAPLVNTANPALASIVPPTVTAGGSAAIPSVLTAAAATTPVAAAVPPLVNTATPWTATLPNATGAGTPVVANLLGDTGGGGLNLPGNLLDWARLGQAGVTQALNYMAQQGASEAQLTAAREALDFAKRAYDEQNAKEQARWEANEARRVPYRQASLASLKELRRVLGIEQDV